MMEEKYKDEVILALDIATKTGWATDTASGTWDFSLKKGESVGMRLIRFKSKVREMIQLEGITVVVYEIPVGRFQSSIVVATEMIGVLKALCEKNKVNYGSYSAKQIKKHFTGNGNAGKPAMIAEAKKRYPDIEIIDDNHADALAILDLVKTLDI